MSRKDTLDTELLILKFEKIQATANFDKTKLFMKVLLQK